MELGFDFVPQIDAVNEPVINVRRMFRDQEFEREPSERSVNPDLLLDELLERHNLSYDRREFKSALSKGSVDIQCQPKPIVDRQQVKRQLVGYSQIHNEYLSRNINTNAEEARKMIKKVDKAERVIIKIEKMISKIQVFCDTYTPQVSKDYWRK